MRPVTTLERFWLCYCAAVSVAALCAGGGGGDGHAVLPFVAVHAVVAALQCVPAVLRRSGRPRGARLAQALLACGGLPVVFSALALVLPHLHPEPFECAWYRLDLRLFGTESTAAARAWLPAAAVLPLQLVYASFYLVPIAAGLLVLRARGAAAFDRAVAILVGGFLCSYAGYVWFPTLAPKVVLPLGVTDGSGFAATVRAAIDSAEANPWDCFPSGHTMLSVTSAIVVWRWSRRQLPFVLAVVVPLIASTVCLRYHWPIDVVAGALLAWPCVRLCDWLLDRDGAAAA